MRARPMPLLAALAIFVAMTPAVSMADIININVDAMFAANGRSIWTGGPGFSLDTGPRFLGIDPPPLGDSVGVVKHTLFGDFGAELGARVAARAGIGYGLKVDSGTFDLHYPARVQFNVPTSVPSGPGDPPSPPTVTIHTSLAGLPGGLALPDQPGGAVTLRTATLQVRGPDLQAFVDLAAELHALVGARACFVICAGPGIGPIDMNESKEIAAINRNGDNAIRVLGNTVSARQSVSALNGHLNASFNLPNLDSSSAATPGGFDGLNLTSSRRDTVAQVHANIAQIAADAVGLPIPLSGKLGPIGYNLLQANAGAWIDVQDTLDFTPSATGVLVFTSDVVPHIGGVDQAPTRVIDFRVGEDVTFTPSFVGEIGVEPIITLGGTMHNRLDLVLGGDVNMKALGVDALGLRLGPLISLNLGSNQLGSINLRDDPFDVNLGTVKGRPFNLSFPDCITIVEHAEIGSVEGACAVSGYGGGVSGLDSDGLLQDELGVFSCDSHHFDEQAVCGAFLDGFTSPYFPGGPQDVFFGSADARNFDPVRPGPSTTDASESADLASLGGIDNPPFIIPPGDPFSAVAPAPAPATVALLGLGFAALLAGRLRSARRS